MNPEDSSEGSFEPVSPEFHGKEAIRIRNVKKEYNGKPEKVEALQVHILMLNALKFLSTGSTTIYNTQLSEITKMEEIRKDIGFCPQFNIQFDFLTVRENLRLFAKIKGIQPEEVEQEVKRVIMELDIENFQDVIAKKLSGGQKRKLTFGIALLGDPQVLLLDEPTAGLDPFSRHRVWNFLKECKTNHVILFSTQFMDEADILADLFRDLEKSSDQGIMNYGISMTTLNEVYLNLKDKSAVDEPDLGIQRQEEICVTRGTEIESEMEQALCSLPEMKKAINSGTLWRRQICAMARLRFLKLRRERKILLSLLVVFGIVLIPVICEKIMFVVFHHTHRWEFSSRSNIEDLVQSLKRQDIVLEVDDFRNRNGSDDPSYNGAIIVSGDHKDDVILSLGSLDLLLLLLVNCASPYIGMSSISDYKATYNHRIKTKKIIFINTLSLTKGICKKIVFEAL
ncbi:ATP-binding cassette sub-family A member 10 [Camelus dromedarius]|uniref:ATP-binding cassette sub-family A member 10 n=1 Tax=Camelus dromedarius TaxID=9838 RepID=A0A5N4D463_CAMDR|nr:ATP-binding cassette sub-family A member 10 [Camelus dromedarius]